MVGLFFNFVVESQPVKTPFCLINSEPATDQNEICLNPTETNTVSESGRNMALNMRLGLWLPDACATLTPSFHFHTLIVYNSSRLTLTRLLPLLENDNEHTPSLPGIRSVNTDRVSLLLASQTWISAILPSWPVAITFLNLGFSFTHKLIMSSV